MSAITARSLPASHVDPIDVAATLARLGTPVSRVTSDSRSIVPGDSFAAYPGEAKDGRAFIPDALRRGARSVLWDNDSFQWPADWNAPNLGIANLKHQHGFIAAWVGFQLIAQIIRTELRALV